MPTVMRLFHILRKGPRPRRVQAWAGVVMVGVAALWLVIGYLWKIIFILLLGVLGLLLIRRALRGSRPSPPSS